MNKDGQHLLYTGDKARMGVVDGWDPEFGEIKLAELTETISALNNMTDGMLGILDHLEEQMDEVNERLKPIRKATVSLNEAERNIDSTVHRMQDAVKFYNIATGVVPQTTWSGEGYINFLKWMENLNDANHFFLTNRFKRGEDIQQKLIELAREGQSELCGYYIQILSGLRHRTEVETETVKRLSEIAQLMEKICKTYKLPSPPFPSLLHKYRGQALKHTLFQLVRPYSVQPKAGKFKIPLPNHTWNLTHTPPGGGQPITSHPVIKTLDQWLEILAKERFLCSLLTKKTLHAEGKSFDYLFEEVVSSSMGFFGQWMAQLLPKTPSAKPTIEVCVAVLDVLHYWMGLRGKFRKIFSAEIERFGNEAMNQIFAHFLRFADRRLKAMIKEISDDSPKSAPEDCGYAKVTILSCDLNCELRKRLPALELLQLEPQNRQQKADSLEVIRESLMENLKKKAKTYNKMMGPIFLLNNLHFISSNLTVGEDEKSRIFLEDLNREKRSCTLKYNASFEEVFQWLVIPEGDLDLSSVDVTLRKVRHRIKDRFRGFNEAVIQIHTKLRVCTIPDPSIRAKILHPLIKELVEKYDQFVKHYTQIEFSNNRSKYILYTSEGLEKMLNQFFSKYSD